jgi:hypothetical protein
MHQMGGHGPAYYKRSPQAVKKFLPECTDNALQSCSREGLLNAYDNSIVYTDKLLASSIQWLKAQEARSAPALLYLADHGESLGENNLYLHGMPYGIAPEVQKRVPWITWLSPGFEQRNKLTTACLKQQLDAPVSHDNYFHSVLGLMNVQTASTSRHSTSTPTAPNPEGSLQHPDFAVGPFGAPCTKVRTDLIFSLHLNNNSLMQGLNMNIRKALSPPHCFSPSPSAPAPPTCWTPSSSAARSKWRSKAPTLRSTTRKAASSPALKWNWPMPWRKSSA